MVTFFFKLILVLVTISYPLFSKATSHNKKRPITFLSGNLAYFTSMKHHNLSLLGDARFFFLYTAIII